MTRQDPDYIKYRNKRFGLIDTELNTRLYNGKIDDNILASTNCWRRYQAEYRINSNNEIERKIDSLKYEKLSYTGKIIIVYSDKRMDTDFLSSVLFYGQEAYELEFDNGNLVNENNLEKAFEEYKNQKDKYNRDIAKEIIFKYLTGNYDKRRTYKWRIG